MLKERARITGAIDQDHWSTYEEILTSYDTYDSRSSKVVVSYSMFGQQLLQLAHLVDTTAHAYMRSNKLRRQALSGLTANAR